MVGQGSWLRDHAQDNTAGVVRDARRVIQIDVVPSSSGEPGGFGCQRGLFRRPPSPGDRGDTR